MRCMAPLLAPLTCEQIRAYEDRECLVDVAVQRPQEGLEVYTFDPLQLPAYYREAFRDQLFQWVTLQGLQPVSAYGRWPGMAERTNATYGLLPVYAEWLNNLWALVKETNDTGSHCSQSAVICVSSESGQ